jgi:L-alanine-DL-glutamate epimerase-like enolase superfamily enzyme
MLPQPTRPGADGFITLPDAPGLGVAIDWEALERLRIDTGTMG